MAVMPILTLKVNQSTLDRVTRDLAGIKDGAKTAVSSAINDTLRKAKTRIAKVITEQINLKQMEVKESISVVPATKAMLMGTLFIKGKRKPLAKFAGRWKRTKPGASYMISKSEGRKTVPGTFMANVVGSSSAGEKTMSNKQRIMQQVLSGVGDSISEHAGIFIRRGKKRLPIREMYGISAVGAFEKVPGLSAMEMETLELDLETRIRSKVDWLISKRDAQSAAASGNTFLGEGI